MKKLLLVLLVISFTSTVFSQQKVIIRFDHPDQQTLKKFTGSAYDVAAYKPGEFLDLFIPETELGKIQEAGYHPQIIKTEAEMAANLGNVDDINGYRTYDEALAELQQIESDHPGLCKLYDIGDSHGKVYYDEGYGNYGSYQHDIWALKLSDNVDQEEDEPAIYYFGNHHAREPLGTEVCFYILNYLLDNYGVDPDVTANVDSKEIWFVPIVNPDGHEVVLNQIDLSWRKNIRDNDENGSVTPGNWLYPDGVDPNRNYGWEWGGEGTTFDPEDQTYCGPEPFSEPEISAIRDLMADQHFVAGISYHTYGQLVLWPYGYTTSAVAPDADALEELGTAMGLSIPGINGGHYTPQPSWALYPCSGTTDDYAYGQYGTLCYTIEMATEFIPPANEVAQISEDNLEAALILLNRPNYAMLTGHITNAETGDPVEAEIWVDEIDNSGSPREPYTSNAQFGSYYRMMTEGAYTVTVSAFGYFSQTFENVEINNDGQTILDVALEQSQVIAVSGTVTDAETGLPIENATIEVMNTPVDPVTTNQNGEYTIDEIYENTYTFKVYALNYATVLQDVQIDQQNNVVNFELTETNAISFETGSFDQGWTFGGSADWTIDNGTAYDGAYSAKSGAISDEQTSELTYSMENPSGGEISFYLKVSSEADYDYLKFYIDDELQGEWSGEVDWQEVSYDVNAGTHDFTWAYEKDYSVSNGSDCGWIDYVIFPPSASVNAQAGAGGEICQGESFQCEGSASYYSSVEWTTSGDGSFSDPVVLNPEYTPGAADIASGNATLTLTAHDDNGNSDSDELELIINPLPAQGTTVSGETTVCAGGSINYSCSAIENAQSIEWTIDPEEAGTIASQNETEVTIAWDTQYFGLASIKVRGINDCGSGEYSPALLVTVEDCTGIGEAPTKGFSVSPNPAQNFINFNLGKKDLTGRIKMFNVMGKVVYIREVAAGTSTVSLELTAIDNGIYFISYSNSFQTYVKKIVVNK